MRPAIDAGALAASQLAAAYRLSPDLILISTQTEGRILDANDAYLQYTGYARSELIGRTTRDLQLWVKADQRTELLEQLAQRGQVHGLEIVYRHKSGEQRWGVMYAEQLQIGD